MRRACSSFALLLLAGCTSLSSYSSARTLPRGRSQFFLAGSGQLALGPAGKPAAPLLEFGGRHGVTDSFELGARGWYGGMALESKAQLHRGQLELALAPSLGWSMANRLSAQLPLLAGVHLREELELVAGPRLSLDSWVDPGAGLKPVGGQLAVGLSLGLAWQATADLKLLPEVSARAPLTPAPDYLGGGFGLQAGLGLLWGG